MGGGLVAPLSLALIGAETDGLAIDFTDLSATVRDTSTPANAFQGDVNDLLTYTSPSTKWILNKSGILVSGTTLRTEYDAAGAALGIRVEQARTNLALHSDDFTQSAWTLSDMDAAKTATGPDGVANSASTLTATDANATALQAITSASARRVTSCYIKRRTGSGDIDLTQNNGSTWTTVTVTSNWTRVEIAAATAANPTVGIRIVTSGDEVDVAFFQHEVAASGGNSTSPIRTAGSTVTRGADNISLAVSAFPYDAEEGTLYLRAVRTAALTGSGLTQYFAALNDGSTDELTAINTFEDGAGSGVLFRVRDGAADQAVLSAGTNGTIVAGTMFKCAAAYASNDFAIVKDGGTAGTDASGTIPTPTTLFIGALASNTQHHPIMHTREFLYLPRRMSNADMQTLTG